VTPGGFLSRASLPADGHPRPATGTVTVTVATRLLRSGFSCHGFQARASPLAFEGTSQTPPAGGPGTGICQMRVALSGPFGPSSMGLVKAASRLGATGRKLPAEVHVKCWVLPAACVESGRSGREPDASTPILDPQWLLSLSFLISLISLR
jgi:hypothetical protein